MSTGLAGLLDDAALFPPTNVPLAEAVAAHRRHRGAWYAELVGPFVCPASRVQELPREPLAVTLTVPGGPHDLPAALAACARVAAVRLASVEVVLPDGMVPAAAVKLLDDSLQPEVAGYFEVPLGVPAVLDALAGTRYRAKFRTGGLEPAAHPSESELARAIVATVERGVPFKCTAGLHHAVRHTDGGLEQHGFLNVLLATHAAAQGAGFAEVAALLALRDAVEVAVLVAPVAAAARAWFTSFGTCSITDPVNDLVRLGLR